jgi:hypothetical protein
MTWVELGEELSEMARRGCSRIRERRKRRVSERERGVGKRSCVPSGIGWMGRSRSMSLIHQSDTAHTIEMEAEYGGATLYMRAGN